MLWLYEVRAFGIERAGSIEIYGHLIVAGAYALGCVYLIVRCESLVPLFPAMNGALCFLWTLYAWQYWEVRYLYGTEEIRMLARREFIEIWNGLYISLTLVPIGADLTGRFRRDGNRFRGDL